MKREPVDFKKNIVDVVTALSEGNPGAMRVLSQIAFTDPTVLVALDDMNIRGPQVWLGYKDASAEMLEVFIKSIRDRDVRMIDTINREYSKFPPRDFRPKAVVSVGHGEREEIE
jgi:hypothetical protein